MAEPGYAESALTYARGLVDSGQRMVSQRMVEGERAIADAYGSAAAYLPSWEEIAASAATIKGIADLGVALNLNQAPFAGGFAWGMMNRLVAKDLTSGQRRVINIIWTTGTLRFLIHQSFYEGLAEGLRDEIMQIPDLLDLLTSGNLVPMLLQALGELTGSAERAFNFGAVLGEGLAEGMVGPLEAEDYDQTAHMIGYFLGPMLLELLIALVTAGVSLAVQGAKVLGQKIILELPEFATELLVKGKRLLARIEGPRPPPSIVDQRMGQLSLADDLPGQLSPADDMAGAISEATPAPSPSPHVLQTPPAPSAEAEMQRLRQKASDAKRFEDMKRAMKGEPGPPAADPLSPLGVERSNAVPEAQRALQPEPSDATRMGTTFKEMSENDRIVEDLLSQPKARDLEVEELLNSAPPTASAEAHLPAERATPGHGLPDPLSEPPFEPLPAPSPAPSAVVTPPAVAQAPAPALQPVPLHERLGDSPGLIANAERATTPADRGTFQFRSTDEMIAYFGLTSVRSDAQFMTAHLHALDELAEVVPRKGPKTSYQQAREIIDAGRQVTDSDLRSKAWSAYSATFRKQFAALYGAPALQQRIGDIHHLMLKSLDSSKMFDPDNLFVLPPDAVDPDLHAFLHMILSDDGTAAPTLGELARGADNVAAKGSLRAVYGRAANRFGQPDKVAGP